MSGMRTQSISTMSRTWYNGMKIWGLALKHFILFSLKILYMLVNTFRHLVFSSIILVFIDLFFIVDGKHLMILLPAASLTCDNFHSSWCNDQLSSFWDWNNTENAPKRCCLYCCRACVLWALQLHSFWWMVIVFLVLTLFKMICH